MVELYNYLVSVNVINGLKNSCEIVYEIVRNDAKFGWIFENFNGVWELI